MYTPETSEAVNTEVIAPTEQAMPLEINDAALKALLEEMDV